MTRRILKRRDASAHRMPASFTLVEMLVSIAILSILSLVLLTMIGSMTATWQAGQASNERRVAGRAVLERMSRELRVASLPGDRQDTNNLELIINPSTMSSNCMLPQAIFWQAPVGVLGTGASTNGNLAVVGYFVQWVNNGTGSKPNMSRVLISPSDLNNNFKIYTSSANWITDSIIANTAPTTKSSSYQGLLANDVLGLWVQALDVNGNPISQSAYPSLPGETFDSRLPYAQTNSSGTYVTNAACSMPAQVQIAIVVVDSHTAQRLTGSERPTTNSLTGNFWSDVQTFYASLPPVIKKGAVIQSTSVTIANGPRQ